MKPTFVQAPDVLTHVFEDNFDDRPDAASTSPSPAGSGIRLIAEGTDAGAKPMFGDGGVLRVADAGPLKAGDAGTPSADAGLPPLMASATAAPAVVDTSNLGPNWYQSKTTAWRIENGRLCGKGARNHGVWLTKRIPINARIEFDAIATSEKGDLKAEIWGDGQSSATSISYTNATSYLAILGGWENTFHVLARINEHGSDRKEIKVDKDSDDPREHAVSVGQVYRFKIERSDSKTVRMFVNNIEYHTWVDAEPLAGIGHDHFGFNNWEVKTCFDNVRITPL